MKITLLCVGKIKERYLNDGIEEYTKRLNRYCDLEIIEVTDEKTPDTASKAMEEQIKRKEAERLKKYIRQDAYLTALAIEGTMKNSIAFAREIEQLAVTGKSHLIFVIGGSLGLHSDIVKQANLLLSFSKFTFPHQLMRLLFLEQLYRAYRIIKGEPYHK